MRSASYIPVLVGSAIVALLVAFKAPAVDRVATSDVHVGLSASELLLDIERYEDLDYGFIVAIPTGWQKIVSADTDADLEQLEPGYAVGFESPNQGGYDDFADYILIEILPGTDSGSFATDGSNRHETLIDGKLGWIDTLNVDGGTAGLNDVDLTVYQAEVSGLGYTVGIYAIGESDRRELMSAAFEVMIRTLRFETDPFDTV